MFAKFLIHALVILAFGPLSNEGGANAIRDKGIKQAVEQAIEEADSSTLRGNYGNQ